MMRPPAFPVPGTRRKFISFAVLAMVMTAAVGASPAFAESAWWHLTSGARPSYIDPGSRQSEVRGLKVEGSTGTYLLEAPQSDSTVKLPYSASAAEIQTALESIYGTGNVTVAASAPAEFRIAFGGQLAERPVLLNARGDVTPSELVRGHADGEVYVTAVNAGDLSLAGQVGAAGVPVHIADVLPAGFRPTEIAATVAPSGSYTELLRVPIPCSLAALTCTLTESLAPFGAVEMRIAVDVEPGASGEGNEARISGGEAVTCAAVPAGSGGFSDPGCTYAAPGAGSFERSAAGPVAPASLSRAITLSSAPVPAGVELYELQDEEEGGGAVTLAGSHPFQSTTTITLNQGADARAVEGPFPFKPVLNPIEQPKDLHFQWPPGLIGDPTAYPTCSDAQFYESIDNGSANACAPATAIGVASVYFNEPNYAGTTQLAVPLFNLKPHPGEPARFGFNIVAGATAVIIDTSLRSDGDYGVTVETNNITQQAALLSSTVSVWGDPGDPHHNLQRGWGCLKEANGQTTLEGIQPCAATATEPGALTPAFLTTPTSCAAQAQSTVLGDTWTEPLAVPDFPELASSTFPLFEGCNQLAFTPKVAAEPTVKSAASSSGLNFDLDFANEGLSNPNGRSESEVKRVTVALPTGVTTNPAVANGLSACSLAQYQAEEIGVQSCPESSKIGEVEIQSPLVEEAIDGSIYVAAQGDNPAHNLLSIYMVAKNANLGVLVKSAGAVTPNPQTGQLSTTFDELPQLPFTHFHLHFREGPRAPLITPGLCGRYTTQAQLYPYSNPNVPVERAASFEVNTGANGQPCASNEAQLPNKPSLEAGTVTPLAGVFSPFVFKVKREDGSQVLSTISATLPTGLLGELAGIPHCTEAQIALAESRSGEGQGAVELASPSCPTASQVGTVSVGTGVGPQPYYVQGKVYLAGAYKGAPLSLAIVTPAVVGPFDLGVIVVRTALYVNAATAQITAVSDPIPTIVHGLPTVVQSVSLSMSRPNFMLNPTSCEAKRIEGSAVSTLGQAGSLVSPFEVGGCQGLKFAPVLSAVTAGKATKAGGASLNVKIAYPSGPAGTYANVRSVKVDLPKQLPSRLTTLQKACVAATFAANPANCPPDSDVGTATAYTPVLSVPFKGPAYLVSHAGEAFPSLEIVLQGEGITLVLTGNTQIKKGITSSTFKTVPDAPVSSFELKLPTGKFSILGANVPQSKHYNLCGQTLNMPTAITGQNGAEIKQTTKISVSGCAKVKALTRPQKLAKALKTCRKKGKGKKASCEKAARQKYGPVKSKKKVK